MRKMPLTRTTIEPTRFRHDARQRFEHRPRHWRRIGWADYLPCYDQCSARDKASALSEAGRGFEDRSTGRLTSRLGPSKCHVSPTHDTPLGVRGPRLSIDSVWCNWLIDMSPLRLSKEKSDSMSASFTVLS